MRLRKIKTEGNLNPMLVLSAPAFEEYARTMQSMLKETFPSSEVDDLNSHILNECKKERPDISEFNTMPRIYIDTHNGIYNIGTITNLKTPHVGTSFGTRARLFDFTTTPGQGMNYLFTKRLSRENAQWYINPGSFLPPPLTIAVNEFYWKRFTGEFYDKAFAELERRSAYLHRGLFDVHL